VGATLCRGVAGDLDLLRRDPDDLAVAPDGDGEAETLVE
jgi:hypothetical protein